MGRGAGWTTATADLPWPDPRSDFSPLTKAALVVVSVEESLSKQLLAHLDRDDVDALNRELARLEHVETAVQRAVLEEFLDLCERRIRFAFEDLVRLDDAAVRLAFHEADVALWALALAGAPRPARVKVLDSLPTSSADALRRALAALGPFRLDEVEAAQAELAERLRRLFDDGLAALPELERGEERLD
jgi:flagellar motor switch protein FliG